MDEATTISSRHSLASSWRKENTPAVSHRAPERVATAWKNTTFQRIPGSQLQWEPLSHPPWVTEALVQRMVQVAQPSFGKGGPSTGCLALCTAQSLAAGIRMQISLPRPRGSVLGTSLHNALTCCGTLANSVSRRYASVSPSVHQRLGSGNGYPL